MNFFEKLAAVSQKNRSFLCVGLDPYQMMITTENELISLNRSIIEATADLACAYKPNIAYYEGMGREGLLALSKTVEIIRQVDPDMPIIGDGKRGDIGNSSLAYANMLFEKYRFDAVTVNPYMGFDSIEPFIQYRDKGIFILCRTSNKGGQDIQELLVTRKGDSRAHPLYEVVAELALKWNKINNNIGLVVGATYPEQLSRVRGLCPNLLFLIPGVGYQGGEVENTVKAAVDAEGKGFIINVSRTIMLAGQTSKGKQNITKMHATARSIRDEINRFVPVRKKPRKPKESQEKGAGSEATPQKTPLATTSRR